MNINEDELVDILQRVFCVQSHGAMEFCDAVSPADAIVELARVMDSMSSGITPLDAAPGRDAFGGRVGSLTESVMGVSSGLNAIAASIERLAEAIESNKQ